MIVYIDMDGVIVNWLEGIKRLTGFTVQDILKEYPIRVERHKYKESIVKNMRMYEHLKVLPDARQLVRYVTDYFPVYRILSASGEYAVEEVRKQKRKWLHMNFPELASDPIFVKHAEDKADYANENSLLIDDTSRAVNPFKEKGNAILHTNADDTIIELKKYL